METAAIKDVFGAQAHTLPVTSVKSMIGESFSASGALSLAAAVGALQRLTLPPTVNYREKDPDCDLDYVVEGFRPKELKNVLVTSVDPYGQNSVIVLGR